MRKKRGGRGGWNGPSRGARGGPAGAGAPGSRRAPPNPSAQAMDSFLAVAQPLSMREEARNTTRDHLKWDRDERLRDRPVRFISAGLIEPLKEMQSGAPSAATPNESTAPDAPAASRSSEDPEPRQVEEGSASTTGGNLFFVDTAGDKSLRAIDIPKPELQLPSHDNGHETDSSEEVILFKGRAAAPRNPPPTTITVHEMRREIEIVAKAQSPKPRAKSATEGQPGAEPPTVKSEASSSRNYKVGAADTSFPSFEAILQDSDHEDEALRDYMENMEGLEDLVAQHQGFASRDIGGSDEEAVVQAEGDSGDLSAADGDDDADSEDAIADDGDPSDSESEVGDGPPDMDDEELARLFAKQESLGISGDELILFDEAAAWSVPSSRSRRKGPRALQKTTKSVPDNAAAVAEMLDDLDLVMDWDRTNPLRKKPKGKHGTVSFDVADEDLKAIMEASFEKDRLKKKERKREREELRAKGLLGKNPNPDDPRIKYVDGINMDQLQQEFTTFLISGKQIHPLPPMDASARKIVHEVSLKLNIKSKSTGRGDQRRPVLHRSNRTTQYNEDMMETVFARVHRRFFPRTDRQRKSGAGGGGGGGGRSGHAAVRYRDGEVVGGSAPELGETNKGRTMLEKMGWSKGMGLGAFDNKGILEPVTHVVKVSKAGLG